MQRRNMFTLAFLIGIYANLIFALGLAGLLYKNYIYFISIIFLLTTVVIFKKSFLNYFHFILSGKFLKIKINRNRSLLFLATLLLLQLAINFIGAISPELAFDALWYHLTLPKIYLLNNYIFHIPGGLLYYSDMPKLAELLYIPSLVFGGDAFAKITHLLFGVVSSIAIYRLSRKFLDKTFSLISVVIFYGNLVVAWQSTTAYVDLARTFFEIVALWGFIEWLETKKRGRLIESSALLGLTISVKLLSVFSLFIFSVLILLKKDYLKEKIKNLVILWSISSLMVFPWLVFSYINTGNPVYPFFESIAKFNSFSFAFLNPINFILEMWKMFVLSSDPISPIYLIFLPLILTKFNKLSYLLKNIALYLFFAIIGWYFVEFNGKNIPEIKGGTRFIMPYLPAFSIVISFIIFNYKKSSIQRNLAVLLVLVISISTILFRGYASVKYLPYVFGKESKGEFLSKHLNFTYGDFYDTDNFFKNNIKKSDKVLLIGFHNLYYIDFPFVDESWVKKDDKFNYVAVKNMNIPNRFLTWNLIYFNPITKVKLLSAGGQEWRY
ncbi:MAG: hypothetical protein COX78_01740 [Candidatus Levybacteria bacterium CG_4_10_14_0_2_um_filter_35_8]|nr:MAG: hypothetical protein COX78_01740 [Candidatus Levybacteria bacterium CG_4_10_14_0_2_um_filter_35_8]